MTQTKIDWRFHSRNTVGSSVEEEYWGEYRGFSVKYIKKTPGDDQYIIEWMDDITILFTEEDLINFVNGLEAPNRERPEGFNDAMRVLDAAHILCGGAADYVHKYTLEDFVDVAIRNGVRIEVSVIKGQKGYIR
jgi:hypothetical protein